MRRRLCSLWRCRTSSSSLRKRLHRSCWRRFPGRSPATCRRMVSLRLRCMRNKDRIDCARHVCFKTVFSTSVSWRFVSDSLVQTGVMRCLCKRRRAGDSTSSERELRRRPLFRLLVVIASLAFSVLLHSIHFLYDNCLCFTISDKQSTTWLLGLAVLSSSFLQKSGNYISIEGTVLSDFTNEYFYSSQ